jgi:hypothetical protein
MSSISFQNRFRNIIGRLFSGSNWDFLRTGFDLDRDPKNGDHFLINVASSVDGNNLIEISIRCWIGWKEAEFFSFWQIQSSKAKAVKS